MSYPAISLATATVGRYRCPQKRLQTARQPPVYPNSSPRIIAPVTPSPPSAALTPSIPVHRWIRAYSQIHPGAVYLHQGEPFLITELDLESKTAYAQRTEVPYYTEVRTLTETRVLNVYKKKLAGAVDIYLGEVRVTTTVIGFTRRARTTSEDLGHEYVELPPQSYDTTALWFDVPRDSLARIRSEGRDLAGGLHAMEHAAIGLLPLFALCDRRDIGGLSTPLHPDTGRPQVFIHDGHPGGVGIAEHGYEVIEALWQSTLEVVSQCPCRSGCPGCVHSPQCGNNNQPLDKGVALVLLRAVLGQEPT